MRSGPPPPKRVAGPAAATRMSRDAATRATGTARDVRRRTRMPPSIFRSVVARRLQRRAVAVARRAASVVQRVGLVALAVGAHLLAVAADAHVAPHRRAVARAVVERP